MALRFSWALLLVAMLVPPSARADVQVQAGDLLMVDGTNNRVVHVIPQSGQSYLFSPRAGSGPNRLNVPNGIAVDPDGTVFVTNTTGELISIDPVTGAQSVVHGFDILFGDFGPVDIGASPHAIDVSDYKASPSDRRDLYVLSEDGIRRVDRTATALSSEIVIPSDSTITNAFLLSLVDDATGPSSAWVSNGTDAVRYDLASAMPTLQSIGSVITGLDFRGTASAGDLYYARYFGTVNPTNGVFSLLGPLSTGGAFITTGAVATTPPNLPLVIYSYSAGSPTFVIAVSFSGSDWVQTFAPLDASLIPNALTVSPVALPESGLAGAALSAVAGLGVLRARRGLRRPAPPHRACGVDAAR